jgi:hypothetical protein
MAGKPEGVGRKPCPDEGQQRPPGDFTPVYLYALSVSHLEQNSNL